MSKTLTKTGKNGGTSLRERRTRARTPLVKWHWLGLGVEEVANLNRAHLYRWVAQAGTKAPHLVPAGATSRY